MTLAVAGPLLRETADHFIARFGRDPEWLVAAPGRVNLIGEHTDYNDGFVLPMAIERHTVIAAARRNTRAEPSVIAHSATLDEGEEFAVVRGEVEPSSHWTDYMKGVIAEYLERGLKAESLELLVSSDIPMGCGLSSSAALQVATARILQIQGTASVSDSEIPGLCQAAEHKFAGVPVGIMDQFCIVHARAGHAVFLDCRSMATEHIPLDDPDIAILVLDSRVSRKLRSGAYAARRSQCARACRILDVEKLRDADGETVAVARRRLGDELYHRARHVTTENSRVVEAVAAVRRNDWQKFGELMHESHDSLRDDFEVSCEEVDILVSLARKIGSPGGVYGARMTGGGFGGCVVSLIARSRAEDIIEALSTGYLAATGKKLSAYVSSPACGARTLKPHQLESL